MKYYEYIQMLEKAKGSNAKLKILKEAIKNPTFKKYVGEIFNPYFNPYCRTVNRALNGCNNLNDIFPAFIKELDANKSRTNDIKNKIEALIDSANHEEVPYLYRFLDRDMRCGVNRGLIKKIAPKLIPEFPIGLASAWNKKKLQFPAYIEPKLDGIRCLAFVKYTKSGQGSVEWYSRNGKPIEMSSEFSNEIIKLANHDYVFDGELMGTDFQQLMTQVKRKKERDQSKLVYNIFDAMPMEDWMEQNSANYIIRKEILNNYFFNFNGKKLALVSNYYVTNENEMYEMYDYFLNQGYEGVVIKQNTSYNFKRSYSWMKLKPRNEYDCIIVDVVAGEKNKKFANTLGALWVELNGVKTQVGSGYTNELRDEIWTDPNTYIGKCVEVVGDCLTNDGCIRFPRFKQFRPDKE